jgi:hypothetical protein
MKCEKGDACRYAHCKEEIAYHPSRYKSAPCSYPLNSQGVCTRFGAHCAFAHSEIEPCRKPILLKQGMPHKQMGDDFDFRHSSGTGSPVSIRSEDVEYASLFSPSDHSIILLSDFTTPIDELPSDRNFYLYQYKTQPCHEPNCIKESCVNYHCNQNKQQIYYSHIKYKSL